MAAAGARDGRAYSREFDRAAKTSVSVDLARNANELTRATRSTTQSVVEMGNAFAGIARFATPAVIAGASVAIVQLGSAAAAAVGTIGLLPGVLGAAGAAFGTLKIATQGFGEAIESMGDPEKFAESLRQLTPAAQQAALEIQALVAGPLKELKSATQEALFDGIGPQLSQLSATLTPELQRLTTTVATSFNTMFRGAVVGLDPAVFSSIVSSIGTAFQNLAGAVQPITQAIMDLVNVGSSFLPDLATGATNAAQAFADLVREAAGTGELQQWIRDGMTVLGMMGETVVTVADMFSSLGSDGVVAMRDIQTAVEAVSTAVKIVSGDMEAWNNVIPSIGDIARKTFEDIARTIDTYLLGPMRAAIDVANSLGAGIPQIPDIARPPQGTVGGGGSFDRPGAPAPGQYAVPGSAFGRAGAGLGEISGWSGNPINTGIGGRGGAGGGSGPTMPILPFPGTDPTSLLQPGMPITAAGYSAASNVIDAQHRVAQEQAELNALIASTTATAEDVQKARNEVAEAERAEVEAKLRLAEQQKSATEQMTQGMASASESFAAIGAHLDSDFGFSKGLPGLADNLVRFLANLATAPIQGALSAIANPQSSVGGSFAPASYGQYGQPSYGGYPGDAALLSRIPAGTYTQENRGDLTQGLADCSSAVEDLVNMLDGRSTAGASWNTGNMPQKLLERGFLPGAGGPGDMRIGLSPSHTQATLPGGTNFNWGSQAAADLGGRQGGGAAAMPQQYFRPVGTPTGALTIPPAMSSAALAGNPALTNPGLSPGFPAQGTVPTGGPLGTGFPNALTTPSYAPTTPSEQAAPSWQPQGGGNLGSGFLGMAMGLASGAAGMGANAFAPGSGAAAQAAADMAQKAIQRTIAFGGQAAGIGMQGLMETFGVSDPDGGGSSGGSSWLTRIAGGLAGAKPATGLGAGKADKESKVDPNAPQNQGRPGQGGQGGQGGQAGPGGPTVSIGQFVQAENRDGQRAINDLAAATYNAHINPGG